MHDHDEDCNMPIDPSQPPTESTPHEPLGETERKMLKPGKGYGIIALLCSLVPGIVMVFVCYVVPHMMPGHGVGYVMIGIFLILLPLCILCVIVGIVYGIEGLKTEGWYYARTGLVLNLLWGLFIFLMLLG